ncbi:MAG TPA: LuxR C-terminal-related transcriptional regulator [Gemmatimonadaceae bacterium]|nr:LuxR C-terminal-related transcriptional regulator [Gemmatimonadaceae bacterium]
MTERQTTHPPPGLGEIDDERNLRVLLVLVLLATIVGGAVDLILDAPDSLWSAHVIFEVSLVLAAVVVMVVLWRGWRGSRRKLVATRQMLEHRAAERDEWRASAESLLAGLGLAIDAKFAAWGLTPTEREIALLLLKGRSHKQIAYATGRSERTVRQHAVTIYQKSGLQGRAELSAFFLEDLFLPADRTPGVTTSA